MNDLKVAVLGCGPAGLMATHAVMMSNKAEVVSIFSRKRKSPLHGAQYLHAPIPGIPAGDPVTVNYSLVGTPEGYRDKVYRNAWGGAVSPQTLADPHQAWDIRRTYNRLWDMYEPLIIDYDINPLDVQEIVTGYDMVINSVPLDALCHNAHSFEAQEIIAAGDAPELGIDVGSMYRCDEGVVVCNGDPEIAWYRKSRIFGHTTIEWPGRLGRVPVSSAAKVRKPLSHNCTCWPQIVKVGRYGAWQKGLLSHEAFTTVNQALYVG